MSSTTDDPSGDGDSTRRIVLALRKESQRREGASTVWRWLGGLAATLALTMAGAALVFAQQAAVDHDAVGRHERQLDGQSESLAQIRAELAAQTALLQRMEQQMDRSEDR
jgi:hypothetical protein